MLERVRTVTPVLYVGRLDVSVAFYALLGFDETARGTDDGWTWAYLTHARLGLLVASARELPEHPAGARGPVQLYLQSDDVAEVHRRIDEAGREPGGGSSEHLGYPAHAPGGELRVLDPDGHVLMIAQTTGKPPVKALPPEERTSILHRAAEAIRSRHEIAGRCDVGDYGDVPCPELAQVKLTDSWGDSAWACLRHAEEALYGARGVYLATEDPDGLRAYLSRRHTHKS